MQSTNVTSGTEGYASQASFLIARYESITFEEKHDSILELLPKHPSRFIDIGSGTGLDAAWLALQGHQVFAVEPVDELLQAAKEIHPNVNVTWVKDSLPKLSTFTDDCDLFDVAMMTAVWMHLDEKSRQAGMKRVASLIKPKGKLFMTLRHGPPPHGRQTFSVSAEEVIRLAEHNGLKTVLNVNRESVGKENRAIGVIWSHLAFRADRTLY